MIKNDIAEMRKATKENPFWIHFGAGNLFRAFHANVVQNMLNNKDLDRGLIVAEGFDYEIIENGIIYVKHAILREVSLVMTGADKDAKISKNSVSDELEKERLKFLQKEKELKELKAKYE